MKRKLNSLRAEERREAGALLRIIEINFDLTWNGCRVAK
jgi:hypothetical protein